MKNNFITFLQSNYNNSKCKLYLFERNTKVPKLFLLLMKIPSKFKNNTYDISLLIYFPLNFPMIQPEIFFHKYSSVKINPNCLNYIDEETLRINYDTFFKWGYSFESFKKLIKEIHNKFNTIFPIFTLNKKNENENENDEGDCYLKEECCKEIDLKNPIINTNNTNNTNDINNINNKAKIKNININISVLNKEIKNNNNKNIIIKKSNTIKEEQSNFIRKSIYNNNNNNKEYTDLNSDNSDNNIIIGKKNDNNDESITYDEDIIKNNLIKILISQLYPNISKINLSVMNTKNNLDKTKNTILTEMKELEEIDKKRANVEKSINLMKNELNNYNGNKMQTNKKLNDKKKDFSNLDTLLTIKNQKKYILLSKEKAIEEYFLIIKKAYEKKLIDLSKAMQLVRLNSIHIFYIKYKYQNLKWNNI